MSRFKVGDKVVCLVPSMWHLVAGEQYTVELIDGFYIKIKEDNGFWDPNRFELVKENKMEQKFDMKTMPWYIRINNKQEFECTQKWLLDNYDNKLHKDYSTDIYAITNIDIEGNLANGYYSVLWASRPEGIHKSAKEIKLSFKTNVDSVEYPEVETGAQKKVKELEQTILNAQQQLAELKKEI